MQKDGGTLRKCIKVKEIVINKCHKDYANPIDLGVYCVGAKNCKI